MFSDKKGFEASVLVGLILVAIVAVVILSVFPIYKDTAVDSTNKQACKTSVLANAKRLEIGGTEITPGLSDINCPTQRVAVKDPEKIKLVMANQMYDCWDKLGQGKIKFLNPESGTYCIICSRVSFEDEAKSKELSGFLGFLAESQIKDDNGNPIPGLDLTYLKFLTDYETKLGELNEIRNNKEDIINTDSDQAIMFLYYKQQLVGEPEGAGLGGIMGCVLGGLVGVGIIASSGGTLMPLVAPIYGITCGAGLAIGSGAGWLIGNDHAAEWGARVINVPYQDIDKLGCSSLE